MVVSTKHVVSLALMALTLLSLAPIGAAPTPKGMLPDQAAVRVEIDLVNGTDASDILVSIARLSSSYGAVSGLTDASGVCLLYPPSDLWGPCMVSAKDAGGALWWSARLLLEPRGNHVLSGVIGPNLPAVNRISGHVRDTLNGSALPGVAILASGRDGAERPFSLSTISAPDGSYEVMVPNSTEQVGLQASAFDHRTWSYDISLIPGKVSYPIEVHMIPTDTGMNASVRFVEIGSGTFLPMGSLQLYGRSIPLDHAVDSRYGWTADPITGYMTVAVDPGEYQYNARSQKIDAWNVTLHSTGTVFANGTAVHLDLELDLPDWRRMDVLLTGSGSPIANGRVGYYQEIAGPPTPYIVQGDAITNGEGHSYLSVPSGKDLILYCEGYDYRTRYYPIAAGTDDIAIEVDLQELGPTPYPKGQISLRVVDPITYAPVPNARTSGEFYSMENDGWSSFDLTTDDRGFCNATVDAGLYPTVDAEHNLGTGMVRNLTVPVGGTAMATIYLKRAELPPEPVPVSFDLKDPEGAPIGGQPISLHSETRGYVLHSDTAGMVTGHLPPGEYVAYVFDEYPSLPMGRTQWVLPHPIDGIAVPEGGGPLPDLVLYPAGPLFAMEGYLRNAETGEAIPGMEMIVSSFRPLDGPPSRQMPYVLPYFSGKYEEDASVTLFQQSSGSDATGFYRAWGRESISMDIYSDLYFPYREGMTLEGQTTRDIMLEPVPEKDVFVNGSLVDHDGALLSGAVLLVDPVHDDYEIGGSIVNGTGEFSIGCYAGPVRAVFGNSSLWDYIDIEVPPEGIADLRLVLAPSTFINGTVTDMRGDPVAGIDLTLSGGWGLSVFDNVTTTTNSSGEYSFSAIRGIYRIDFKGSDIYRPFNVTGMECSGWAPLTFDMVLEDLTEGYVSGRVIGSGGPYDGVGIPSAFVYIWPADDWYSFVNTTTDENGFFSFDPSFDIGTVYVLGASSPTNISGREGVRSGYLWNDTGNMTLKAHRTDLIILIPYHEEPNMTWVNITEFSPMGEGVLLNEPIRINFTHRMKFSINDVSIEPLVQLSGLEFTGTGVVIPHANFEANTRYTFMFPGDVFSIEGYPLWNHTGITWSFTTGSTYWHLDSANVYTVDALELHVDVLGQPNLTVFIVINGVGSFELDEGDPGGYTTEVNGSYFGWNRNYRYHFSDRAGGEDLAPTLSGSFWTPTGGKPPQPPDGEIDDEMTPLGCLTCCGIGSAVIAAIVGAVLLLSRIKSRYDEREE